MAKIRIIPPEDWAVLEKYLDQNNLVLIPKVALDKFNDSEKQELLEMDEELFDYNFGGEPDFYIDVIQGPGSYAADCLLCKPED